jgi:hypothetical protein
VTAVLDQEKPDIEHLVEWVMLLDQDRGVTDFFNTLLLDHAACWMLVIGSRWR